MISAQSTRALSSGGCFCTSTMDLCGDKTRYSGWPTYPSLGYQPLPSSSPSLFAIVRILTWSSPWCCMMVKWIYHSSDCSTLRRQQPKHSWWYCWKKEYPSLMMSIKSLGIWDHRDSSRRGLYSSSYVLVSGLYISLMCCQLGCLGTLGSSCGSSIGNDSYGH